LHELGLSRAILDIVVRHAGGGRVTVVNLRVGELRQVIPDTLAFYFGLVARGTLCEGARLEHELVVATLRCTACADEWKLEAPAFRCPSCGSSQVIVQSGEEFHVESIEVEEVECIGPR
jgi:hydrogenase nickel incorporation protein HypA/HybF